MAPTATTVFTTVLPRAADEPSWLVTDNGARTLAFDSLGHHVLHPPSADYLRRLAAQATALADRMDELTAGGRWSA